MGIKFLMKRCVYLFFLIALTSCATVVYFDVDHPPLIDLRGVNSITVIPFEWNSISIDPFFWNSYRDNREVAEIITSALMNGLRRADITIIDPQVLEDIEERNYYQFTDVYVTGRLMYVELYSNRIQQVNPHILTAGRRFNVTGTAVFEIEYSYIRAVDRQVLGTFIKREQSTRSFVHISDFPFDNWSIPATGWRSEYRPNPGGRRSGNRDNNHSARRPPGGIIYNFSFQREPWLRPVAEAAAARFSNAMSHELAPWTTTERRNIRRRTGVNALAAQGRRFVRYENYTAALDRFTAVFEQGASVFAAYNTAVLLSALGRFNEALALLEDVQNRLVESGKNSPAFIRREIRRIREFARGYAELEEYRARRAAAVSAGNGTQNIVWPPVTVIPAVNETVRVPAGREIAGTVNLEPAVIYVLNESISSLDDDSVFIKMAAYTYADNGQWSIRLPPGLPDQLWLIATDGVNNYFITQLPQTAAGTITLDTDTMTRLE